MKQMSMRAKIFLAAVALLGLGQFTFVDAPRAEGLKAAIASDAAQRVYVASREA